LSFVAPRIHRVAGNIFWISVKYEYEGQPQKIIPITIQQFIETLRCLLHAKKRTKNYSLVSVTKCVSKSGDWLASIPAIVNKWGKSIAA
jgi:hypothetical protein